jgi:hypothetical protein
MKAGDIQRKILAFSMPKRLTPWKKQAVRSVRSVLRPDAILFAPLCRFIHFSAHSPSHYKLPAGRNRGLNYWLEFKIGREVLVWK